jgi:hypothetical protein
MNLSATQSSSAPNLGFSLIGGALAGFLFAAEVSLLQPLLWAIGCSAGMDDKELLWLTLRCTAATLFFCVGTGLLGGSLWAILPSRLALGIRRAAPQLLPALWVSASLMWGISGPMPVIVVMPLRLIDAMLTLATAAAAYFFLCLLMRWMGRECIGRLICTIVATGVALWIPFGAYLALR